LVTFHLFPDEWLACSQSCKLAWSEDWLRSHVLEALRLHKPLLLAGFGSGRPHGYRSALTRLVTKMMGEAVEKGHPVAGVEEGL